MTLLATNPITFNPPVISSYKVESLSGYPTHRFPSIPEEIALGDLHANLSLFLNYLIVHNIIDMSEESYGELYWIMQRNQVTRPLEPGELVAIRRILNGITLNEAARDTRIILLGDESSDRIGNDFILLLLLGRMHTLEMKYEIMLSNHGIEFMHFMENDCNVNTMFKLNSNDVIDDKGVNWGSPAQSLLALRKTLELMPELKDEAINLYKTVYRPKIKVLSYNYQRETKTLTLYQHAPTGYLTLFLLFTQARLLCLFQLKDSFEALFNPHTPEGLTGNIDKINDVFQRVMHKIPNWFDLAFRIQSIFETKTFTLPSFINEYCNNQLELNPLVRITWHRQDPELEPFEGIFKLPFPLTYPLRIVHGHDGDAAGNPFHTNSITLNSMTGKHPYTVLDGKFQLKQILRAFVFLKTAVTTSS